MTSSALFSHLVYQIVEAKLSKNFPQESSLRLYPASDHPDTLSHLSLTINQAADVAFLLSRTALDLAAQKADPFFARTTLDFAQRTRITSDYHLQHFPEILLSLSHSKNYGAAVIRKVEVNNYKDRDPNQTLSTKITPGIGIDLELASRRVRPEIITHIQNPRDNFKSLPSISCGTLTSIEAISVSREHLTALMIWCLKEACFKALAAQNPEVKFISEIWLDYPSFGYAPLPGNEGKIIARPANKNVKHALLNVRGVCQVQIITDLAQPLVVALAESPSST